MDPDLGICQMAIIRFKEELETGQGVGQRQSSHQKDGQANVGKRGGEVHHFATAFHAIKNDQPNQNPRNGVAQEHLQI